MIFISDRSFGSAGSRPATPLAGAVLADQQRHDDEAASRNRRRPQPARRPAGMFGDQDRHQRRGGRDAEADAAEMQRLQVAAVGSGEMAEDDAGHEHHDEGAGQTGQKADDEKGGHRVGQPHQRGEDGAGGKAAKHQQTLAPMRPAAGRRQRADEVAEIVGRGDPAGIGRRQMRVLPSCRAGSACRRSGRCPWRRPWRSCRRRRDARVRRRSLQRTINCSGSLKQSASVGPVRPHSAALASTFA